MAESTAAICDVYLCVSDVCPLLTLRDPPQIHLSNLNSYRRYTEATTTIEKTIEEFASLLWIKWGYHVKIP